MAVVASQELPPGFRARVDLLVIDVQVVAKEGKPMPALTAASFAVKIAGRTRTVVVAELAHADEGPVVRHFEPPRVDAATRAACVFGFERISNGATAHYLLGLEPIDSDKTGVYRPQIKVKDSTVTLRRFAWRTRITAPASPGGTRYFPETQELAVNFLSKTLISRE